MIFPPLAILERERKRVIIRPPPSTILDAGIMLIIIAILLIVLVLGTYSYLKKTHGNIHGFSIEYNRAPNYSLPILLLLLLRRCASRTKTQNEVNIGRCEALLTTNNELYVLYLLKYHGGVFIRLPMLLPLGDLERRMKKMSKKIITLSRSSRKLHLNKLGLCIHSTRAQLARFIYIYILILYTTATDVTKTFFFFQVFSQILLKKTLEEAS